jgi:hypothetical protein
MRSLSALLRALSLSVRAGHGGAPLVAIASRRSRASPQLRLCSLLVPFKCTTTISSSGRPSDAPFLAVRPATAPPWPPVPRSHPVSAPRAITGGARAAIEFAQAPLGFPVPRPPPVLARLRLRAAAAAKPPPCVRARMARGPWTVAGHATGGHRCAAPALLHRRRVAGSRPAKPPRWSFLPPLCFHRGKEKEERLPSSNCMIGGSRGNSRSHASATLGICLGCKTGCA